MPTIIPLTDRQRQAITALQQNAQHAQSVADAYCAAIIQGFPDSPSEWGGLMVTRKGLVVDEQIPGPTTGPTINVPLGDDAAP